MKGQDGQLGLWTGMAGIEERPQILDGRKIDLFYVREMSDPTRRMGHAFRDLAA